MSIQFKPGFEDYVPLPRPRKYKTPVHLLPKLQQVLKVLMEKGFIKHSTSPFSAPCMLVVKPHQEGVAPEDLKYRLVVDLRDINQVTVPMHHRIPDISAIWSRLGDAKVISVLDLTKGFHQESLNEEDGSSAKTAFSTEFGHFEFVGCVMGARNTPVFFQSRVESALRSKGLLDVGMLRQSQDGLVEVKNSRVCCTPYIDDLVIYSDSIVEQHEEDLAKVLNCLSENRYYIEAPKCSFGCRYVSFCGGIVGNGILAMDPIKVATIQEWDRPTNATELRGFLGMANYLKP